MEDNYQPIQIYQKILEMDYENKVCVECKCPMPSFVSINNAIILCDRCAERHQRLGYNVSYVRNITSDWDPYLFSFLERGGNSRFIRLSKKFQLDDMPIEQKFNTRIVEYYRLLVSKIKIIDLYLQLKSEVLAEEPPYEVPYENAKDPINNQIIYFPEFQEYQIYVGKLIPKKKTSEVIEAFRYVGNGLGCMGNYIAEKYQENDMNNKLIEGGAIAAKGVVTVGKAIYKVGKPVVKYTTIRAIQGIGYLCDQIVNILSDGNKKEDEKEENKKEEDKKEKNNKIEQNNPNQNNQMNSLDLPDGGQLIFKEREEYPSFESIDRIYKNNNNINNNYNNINNNIMQNNLNNNNININNIQNQNNINMMYNKQYNNNQVKRPDYSTAKGLDYSIIGEI